MMSGPAHGGNGRVHRKGRFDKKRLLLSAGVFSLLFMVYSFFLNFSMISDHISMYYKDPGISKASFISSFAGGRIGNYALQLCRYFFALFHVSKYENQLVLQLLLLILLTCTLMKLEKMTSRYFGGRYSETVQLLLLSICFVNPYFVETFHYVAWELGAALFICVCAGSCFEKKKYLCSALLLLLVISIYQSYAELYLIFGILLVFLRENGKPTKAFFRSQLQLLLITVAAALADILPIKAAVYFGMIGEEVKPVNMQGGLWNRLYNAAACYKIMSVDGFGYFPKWMLFFVTAALFLAGLAFMLKRRASVPELLLFAAVSGIQQFLTIAIYLISGSWVTGRTGWPYFAAMAASFLLALFEIQKTAAECAGQGAAARKDVTLPDAGTAEDGKRGLWSGSNFVFAVFLLLAFFDLYVTETVETDSYIANKLDELELSEVEAEIRNYEKQSGTEVTEVSARRTPDSMYYSPLLNLHSVATTSNITMLYNAWSDVEALNYFEGESYAEFEMTDADYSRLFGDRTWKTFIPEEQLVFEGSRLYWAIY
ncbi:MAG: glucosyltransferase domain-containing protein [Lachnospiraceae bacterium]|jgi:hypothetical protein|nr:glucosyltransferase domain-containing protein [Lachnospiraceae bacterium]